MTRIAPIGPGAVGATVAAWLARSPDLAATLCFFRETESGDRILGLTVLNDLRPAPRA